jgi:hypothetical protein
MIRTRMMTQKNVHNHSRGSSRDEFVPAVYSFIYTDISIVVVGSHLVEIQVSP